MGRLFGTDGVRGIAGAELTPDRALLIGRAAGSIFVGGKLKKPRFLIGTDTRISSGMLASAVAAGVASAGADVELLGVIPTPAVAFLVRASGADAGIMISASHNSFEYNGIKIFGGDGYKLPDEIEEKIEDFVLAGEQGNPPTAALTGGALGRVNVNEKAIDLYKKHLLSSTTVRLDGLKIALDCACGSASMTAEEIFRSLGAEVHTIYDRPDGVNINAGCGSTHIEALSRYVTANSLDCGLAFDGDADRLLCVDENGDLVDGDRIMAVCALDMKWHGKLKNDTVVGTIMTNFGFTRFCHDNGIHFIATKVGDRFVLEEMLVGEYSLGGEQSGHIIFRDFATTGDGQLTAIQLLSILKRNEKPLSALASVMTRSPQELVNLRVSPEGKARFYTDDDIKEAIEKAKLTLGENGRIVVRPSGTEPLIRVMTEGDDTDLILKITNEVADIIRRKIGE